MLKTSNKKVLAGIIVTLLVLSLIAIGYTIKSNESDDSQTDQPIENALTDTEGVVKAKDGYLTIAEYGIRLKLTESTKDLNYFMFNDKAYLSSDSLAAAEPTCSAKYDDGTAARGVAFVTYYTDPNALEPIVGILKNNEVYPDALQKEGKYYYVFSDFSRCVNKSGERSPDDPALKIEQAIVSAINNKEIVLEEL